MKTPTNTDKPIKNKLTLKQKKFTVEVIKSGNGTKAAIKAGYSKKTARQMASENLTKPVIQQEIQSAAEKLGINPEYVLKNLKNIADFNQTIFDKYDQNGNKKQEMADAAAANRATELLGKHLKIFTDKIELDAKVDQVIEDKTKRSQIAKKIGLLLLNPELLEDSEDI